MTSREKRRHASVRMPRRFYRGLFRSQSRCISDASLGTSTCTRSFRCELHSDPNLPRSIQREVFHPRFSSRELRTTGSRIGWIRQRRESFVATPAPRFSAASSRLSSLALAVTKSSVWRPIVHDHASLIRANCVRPRIGRKNCNSMTLQRQSLSEVPAATFQLFSI